VLKHGLKIYNQPIDIDDIWPAARLATTRLEKLKSMFAKNPDWHGIPYPPIDPMTQQPMPAMGPNGQPIIGPDGQPQPSQQTIEFATLAGQIVSAIPIRPKLDPHELLVKEYQDWSLTDDGINACPLEETVVSMWCAQHEQQIQQPQQEQQQAMIHSQQEAQQKDMQAQAQVEAAKAQQQAQLEGDHANAAAHTDVLTHLAKTAIDVHADAQRAKIEIDKAKKMPKPPVKPAAKK